MWVARDKDGTLHFFSKRPTRVGVGWIVENNVYGYSSKIDSNLFPDLKWEDEPIEVSIETVHELKETYKELINLQTKQINNLTRVFRGMPLEEVSETIKNIEERIYEKYKMIGNPLCSQSTRGVTIANHHSQIGDNSLREYIVDDKVMVTIYVRRNDFNNADILVTDFGDEYKTE